MFWFSTTHRHLGFWLRPDKTCTKSSKGNAVHSWDGSISSVCFVEGTRGSPADKVALHLLVSLNRAEWRHSGTGRSSDPQRRERCAHAVRDPSTIYYFYEHVPLVLNTSRLAGCLSVCVALQLTPTTLFHYENYITGLPPSHNTFPLFSKLFSVNIPPFPTVQRPAQRVSGVIGWGLAAAPHSSHSTVLQVYGISDKSFPVCLHYHVPRRLLRRPVLLFGGIVSALPAVPPLSGPSQAVAGGL